MFFRKIVTRSCLHPHLWDSPCTPPIFVTMNFEGSKPIVYALGFRLFTYCNVIINPSLLFRFLYTCVQFDVHWWLSILHDSWLVFLWEYSICAVGVHENENLILIRLFWAKHDLRCLLLLEGFECIQLSSLVCAGGCNTWFDAGVYWCISGRRRKTTWSASQADAKIANDHHFWGRRQLFGSLQPPQRQLTNQPSWPGKILCHK